MRSQSRIQALIRLLRFRQPFPDLNPQEAEINVKEIVILVVVRKETLEIRESNIKMSKKRNGQVVVSCIKVRPTLNHTYRFWSHPICWPYRPADEKSTTLNLVFVRELFLQTANLRAEGQNPTVVSKKRLSSRMIRNWELHIENVDHINTTYINSMMGKISDTKTCELVNYLALVHISSFRRNSIRSFDLCFWITRKRKIMFASLCFLFFYFEKLKKHI